MWRLYLEEVEGLFWGLEQGWSRHLVSNVSIPLHFRPFVGGWVANGSIVRALELGDLGAHLSPAR